MPIIIITIIMIIIIITIIMRTIMRIRISINISISITISISTRIRRQTRIMIRIRTEDKFNLSVSYDSFGYVLSKIHFFSKIQPKRVRLEAKKVTWGV